MSSIHSESFYVFPRSTCGSGSERCSSHKIILVFCIRIYVNIRQREDYARCENYHGRYDAKTKNRSDLRFETIPRSSHRVSSRGSVRSGNDSMTVTLNVGPVLWFNQQANWFTFFIWSYCIHELLTEPFDLFCLLFFCFSSSKQRRQLRRNIRRPWKKKSTCFKRGGNLGDSRLKYTSSWHCDDFPVDQSWSRTMARPGTLGTNKKKSTQTPSERRYGSREATRRVKLKLRWHTSNILLQPVAQQFYVAGCTGSVVRVTSQSSVAWSRPMQH